MNHSSLRGLLADQLLRLEGLLNVLTHQHIRELRSAIEKVDLRCDFIAKLPLEISQMILQCLPLYQVFQARRVSSKWNQILKSNETVEPLLRHWYPKHDLDLALRIPDGLSAESVASFKAEHIDAHRSGRAFSYAYYAVGNTPDFMHSGSLAYAFGVVAWIDETDSDMVRSFDLMTGQKSSFVSEARTSIRELAISSSMVVAFGSGRCHVWTLGTRDVYHVRLPSDRDGTLLVSRESLAVVLFHSDYRFEVVTWTLKCQKTSSFSVPRSAQNVIDPIRKVMLDDRGESFLVFLRSRDPLDEKVLFHYIRTSLNGDVLSEGVIETPNAKDYEDVGICKLKESNGKALVWLYGKTSRVGIEISELMLICYNFRNNQLEVRNHVVEGLRTNSHTRSDLNYLQNALHYLDFEDGHRGLRVIDLEHLNCTESKIDIPAYDQHFDRQLQEEDDDLVLFVFGDETFFIAIFDQGFCVWCFDKNVRMANEDPTYKEERRNVMKKKAPPEAKQGDI